MAKFHGLVGFMQTVETVPGVHKTGIIERPCQGDILRNTQQIDSGEYLNDNIDINNRFSIVADEYAYDNIPNIRYIMWNDIKWKVTVIDIQRPRLILNVRGVYNG